MNQLPQTPTKLDDIHQRLLSLVSVAVDIGKEFLSKSKYGKATKMLLDELIKKVIAYAEKSILEMPEADIRKQIYYVRDEVIPFLLGGEHAEPKDTDKE